MSRYTILMGKEPASSFMGEFEKPLSMNIPLKSKIKDVLRRHFPDETIDISDGFGDNIHILVVSCQFRDMGERSKQDLFWGFIEQSDLTDEEKVRISLIDLYSPDDLK